MDPASCRDSHKGVPSKEEACWKLGQPKQTATAASAHDELLLSLNLENIQVNNIT